MKKSIFACVFCLLTAFAVKAQQEKTVLGSSGLGLSGVWLGGTTTLSQFNGSYSPYYGFAWGLEFGKALLVGVNHYQISNEQAPDGKAYSMTSNGLLLQYALGANKAFHPILGLVGSTGSLTMENASSKIFTVEPMAGLEVNVLRWFHLDIDGGYRLVAGSKIPGYTDANFSGAFADVKLKFGWSWGNFRTGW